MPRRHVGAGTAGRRAIPERDVSRCCRHRLTPSLACACKKGWHFPAARRASTGRARMLERSQFAAETAGLRGASVAADPRQLECLIDEAIEATGKAARRAGQAPAACGDVPDDGAGAVRRSSSRDRAPRRGRRLPRDPDRLRTARAVTLVEQAAARASRLDQVTTITVTPTAS